PLRLPPITTGPSKSQQLPLTSWNTTALNSPRMLDAVSVVAEAGAAANPTTSAPATTAVKPRTDIRLHLLSYCPFWVGSRALLRARYLYQKGYRGQVWSRPDQIRSLSLIAARQPARMAL